MAEIDADLLYREHFARIHRAALVMCGDPWTADDIAQETFLIVARQKHEFRGDSQIYTWLYGIMLNIERQRRRKRDRRQKRLRIFRENQQDSPESSPAASAALETSEWKQSLWSEVANLPDGQRQALVLRFSEQLRYEEIAAALQCPLGTVKSRIYHGLASLRERLQDSGDKFSIPAFPAEEIPQRENQANVSRSG